MVNSTIKEKWKLRKLYMIKLCHTHALSVLRCFYLQTTHLLFYSLVATLSVVNALKDMPKSRSPVLSAEPHSTLWLLTSPYKI